MFTSFLHNENWDILDVYATKQAITAMYFALTTLSTTGFGDLHPVTDSERFICCFVLLSGVTVMSYVLKELRYMMYNIKELCGDIDEKE